MIDLYRKDMHTFTISRGLLEDKEGALNAGYRGLFSGEDDCDFWDYKIINIDSENGALYGFCFCSFTSTDNTVAVNSLYVSPKWRNKRVGTDLLNNIIGYYKNLNATIIKVLVFEGEQQKFYEKFGFKKDGCFNHGLKKGNTWIRKYQYILEL